MDIINSQVEDSQVEDIINIKKYFNFKRLFNKFNFDGYKDSLVDLKHHEKNFHEIIQDFSGLLSPSPSHCPSVTPSLYKKECVYNNIL